MTIDSDHRGEYAERIVRYGDLVPQVNSFIDRRTPGNTDQEAFSVIGRGVVENKNQNFVHIDKSHGFYMGGVRQHPGCSNSQHSHGTLETFIVHQGTFTFYLGPDCTDGELTLHEGDVISIPTQVFRGFRNTGDTVGHLASTISGDDPGRVTWAPYVFDEARTHGLYLLENGDLVDTNAGEALPEDINLFPATTEEDLANFRRIGAEDMAGWFVRDRDLRPDLDAPLAGEGVEECPVIGVANAAEGISAGPIPAPHGFHARRIRMSGQAEIAEHNRREPEVIFVHRGAVTIEIDGVAIALGQGDYFSLPTGVPRRWRNHTNARNDLHVIRGGDHPAPPVWTT